MNAIILTLITFFPIVGIFRLLLINSENENKIKRSALLNSIMTFMFSLHLYFHFDSANGGMQFVQNIPWIPGFGISYHVGIDGISLLLFVLTTFLTPICILASWGIKDKIKEYMMALLFLEVGMLGVFISLDFFLFYVFWEIMLIPMYMIIGVWGGPRRIYAAVKFFIYTMAGSVLMLLAIIGIYYTHGKATGNYTFDLITIQQFDFSVGLQFWLFLAFAIAFAIKVPMFPFHTWLPDAHVEAPTAGSVILAGVLLKMGTYGFLRFCFPLFPHACHEFIPIVSWLAIAGIIYGALVAMVQDDLKKLVAYSSVSHLGFVMLGMFAFNSQGVEGSIIQMVNHGISTGALFLAVGVIYDRRHTRLISEFGGLTKRMPIFSAVFLIVALSSIGLPGLNGFVGEFLILLGVFKVNYIYAGVAATGVILAAAYMLWMFQRVMFNKMTNPENEKLKDLNAREYAMFIPLLILCFWLGIYPKPFFSKMEVSVRNLLETVDSKYKIALDSIGDLDNSVDIVNADSSSVYKKFPGQYDEFPLVD